MQTEIELFFGDGSYLFALKMAQIVAIEDKCGPIGEVFSRLLKGRYINAAGEGIGLPTEAAFRHIDLIEVIRQGLIGGGRGLVDGESVLVDSLKANKLVEIYVHGRPLAEAWSIATAVMSALIEGYEPVDEAQKKSLKQAARQEKRSASTGGKSSQTAQ